MKQITPNRNSRHFSNFPSLNHPTPHNNFSRSHSTNFLDRNFTMVVEHQKHLKKLQSTIISKDSLNAIQRKLKNYYNEMLIHTKHKQNDLDILHDDHKFLSFKLDQLIEFQDIELPDEKISVRNFEDLKSSKSQIESRLRALVKEKMQLDDRYKNETEYSKTIEYLYQNEQRNLEQIHENIIDTETKLATINNASKNVNANIEEKNKKTRNYSQVLDRLTEDIEMIDTVLGRQMKKTMDLDTDLAQKEEMINKKRTHMMKETEHKTLRFSKVKEQTMEKIRSVGELIRGKFNKEKSYIKTILCLHLIQKHFIEVEELNLQRLVESKEYNELMNDKIIIVDKDNNVLFNSANEKDFDKTINNMNHSGISMHQTFRSNFSRKDSIIKLKPSCNSMDQLKGRRNSSSTKQLPLGLSSNNNNKASIGLHITPTPNGKGVHLMTVSQSKPLRIEVSELINKFNSIHITKQHIYEYYSKNLSRINFYRNQFIDCNKKQIILEEKKDRFDRKVKEIIKNDYKNFIDLIKNDSRFKDLMMKNQDIIDIAKEKHEVARFDKINNNFRSMEIDDNVIDDNTNVSPINSIEKSSGELYHTAEQTISNIRNLMDTVQSLLRTMPRDEERKRILRVTDKLNKQLSEFKHPSFEDYVLSLLSYIEPLPELQQSLNEIIKEDNCIKTLREFIAQEKTFGEKVQQKNLPIESFIYSTIKDNASIIKAMNNVLSFSKQHCSEHHLASAKKNVHTRTHQRPPKYLLRPKEEVQVGVDDSYSENDTALSDNKTVKKTNNSIDERIIRKLYEPTLERTVYSRGLNDNMKLIKGLTISHSKDNFALNKKKSEIEELSHNLLLYNNPRHKAAYLKKTGIDGIC